MKFSIKEEINEEILNGKLHFCAVKIKITEKA